MISAASTLLEATLFDDLLDLEREIDLGSLLVGVRQDQRSAVVGPRRAASDL
jgi:hypothetical protein